MILLQWRLLRLMLFYSSVAIMTCNKPLVTKVKGTMRGAPDVDNERHS